MALLLFHKFARDQIIFEKNFSVENPFGTINVNIEKLISSGVYLLQLESGSLFSTLKLVKQ